MTDKMIQTMFEMNEVNAANMRGDENKSARASPNECGQIKQVASNIESASPIRRQATESAPADTTTTTTTNNNSATTPTRRNQSAKPTPVKSQRQRARRSAGRTIRSQQPISSSLKSQARPARKQMARCTSAHICYGCKRPINDRFLLGACDKHWHEDCLKCDRCHAKLGELGSTLYERDNMNLCRQDYLEMFGQKAICAVCDKLIYASEMVMRARDNVYHLECFACQLCGLRFCIGDRFHLCENKIVCQYDYDEHICPLQATMFDYNNGQQFPPGPPSSSSATSGFPTVPSLGLIPQAPYQQPIPTSGYMSMLASNSLFVADHSELVSCGYSQSTLLESNHITTTTTTSQPGQETSSSLTMLISDQDQQTTTGERIELTMLDNCERAGNSNESDASPDRALVQPTDSVNCDGVASKRIGDGTQ